MYIFFDAIFIDSLAKTVTDDSLVWKSLPEYWLMILLASVSNRWAITEMFWLSMGLISFILKNLSLRVELRSNLYRLAVKISFWPTCSDFMIFLACSSSVKAGLLGAKLRNC
jgi:hypothetical protein